MDFKKPDAEFTRLFWELVSQSENIVITSHESPDDDSIGASLSLLEILSQKSPDKKVRVLYSGSPEERYKYFDLYKKVEFTKNMADILPEDTQLLICLDGSQFSRFTKTPEKLSSGRFKTICIDHHSSPTDAFSLSLIDSQAASSTELIYKCFHNEITLSKQLAEILMLGILGDTGNFNYLKANQLDVFDVTKVLMKASEMDLQDFRSKYDTISPRVFEIIKRFIANSNFQEVPGWPPFMTIYVDREFISENKFTDNETSSASHIFMSSYFRVITGYPWGISIVPKTDGSCGISLRSLPGSVSGRSVLERMGLGGGHDRAAGGSFKTTNGEALDPKNCLNQVTEWLKQNEVVVS